MTLYTTTQPCAWCHELLHVGDRLCPNCGHEPHVARTACRCGQCENIRRLTAGQAPPRREDT